MKIDIIYAFFAFFLKITLLKAENNYKISIFDGNLLTSSRKEKPEQQTKNFRKMLVYKLKMLGKLRFLKQKNFLIESFLFNNRKFIKIMQNLLTKVKNQRRRRKIFMGNVYF